MRKCRSPELCGARRAGSSFPSRCSGWEKVRRRRWKKNTQKGRAVAPGMTKSYPLVMVSALRHDGASF